MTSRAENQRRRDLLAALAAELAKPDGPGAGLGCRLRAWPLPWPTGWLAVTAPGRRRPLRVLCLGLGETRGFITAGGQLIAAADLGAAARDVAAAARAGT